MAHVVGCLIAERVAIAQTVGPNDSPLGLPIYPFSQPPVPMEAWTEPQSPYSQSSSFTPFIPGHVLQPCQNYAGHLSLHDYRKFLSQPYETVISGPLRGRTLKRKTGAMNLSHRRDMSLSLTSSMSSAPSSPPPLSFSQSVQSVISYHSNDDLNSPFNSSRHDSEHTRAIPVISSPLSHEQDLYYAPQGTAWHKQNIENFNTFRGRLRNNSDSLSSLLHHKSSSDSALMAVDQSKKTIHHEGVPFEIINPRDSLELARIVSPSEDPRYRAQGSFGENRRISAVSALTAASSPSDQGPPGRVSNGNLVGSSLQYSPATGGLNLRSSLSPPEYLVSDSPLTASTRDRDFHTASAPPTRSSSRTSQPGSPPRRPPFDFHITNEVVMTIPRNPSESGSLRNPQSNLLGVASCGRTRSLAGKLAKLFRGRFRKADTLEGAPSSPRPKSDHGEGFRGENAQSSGARASCSHKRLREEAYLNPTPLIGVSQVQLDHSGGQRLLDNSGGVALQGSVSTGPASRNRTLFQGAQPDSAIPDTKEAAPSSIRRRGNPGSKDHHANRFYSIHSLASEDSGYNAVHELPQIPQSSRTPRHSLNGSEPGDLGEPGCSIYGDQTSVEGEIQAERERESSTGGPCPVTPVPPVNDNDSRVCSPYVNSRDLDAFIRALAGDNGRSNLSGDGQVPRPTAQSREIAGNTRYYVAPFGPSQIPRSFPTDSYSPLNNEDEMETGARIARSQTINVGFQGDSPSTKSKKSTLSRAYNLGSFGFTVPEARSRSQHEVEDNRDMWGENRRAFVAPEGRNPEANPGDDADGSQTVAQHRIKARTPASAADNNALEQGQPRSRPRRLEIGTVDASQPPLSLHPRPLHPNPLLMHPARPDLAHFHRLHQDYLSGRTILVPEYLYEGDGAFPNRNALRATTIRAREDAVEQRCSFDFFEAQSSPLRETRADPSLPPVSIQEPEETPPHGIKSPCCCPTQ